MREQTHEIKNNQTQLIKIRTHSAAAQKNIQTEQQTLSSETKNRMDGCWRLVDGYWNGFVVEVMWIHSGHCSGDSNDCGQICCDSDAQHDNWWWYALVRFYIACLCLPYGRNIQFFFVCLCWSQVTQQSFHQRECQRWQMKNMFCWNHSTSTNAGHSHLIAFSIRGISYSEHKLSVDISTSALFENSFCDFCLFSLPTQMFAACRNISSSVRMNLQSDTNWSRIRSALSRQSRRTLAWVVVNDASWLSMMSLWICAIAFSLVQVIHRE